MKARIAMKIIGMGMGIILFLYIFILLMMPTPGGYELFDVGMGGMMTREGPIKQGQWFTLEIGFHAMAYYLEDISSVRQLWE